MKIGLLTDIHEDLAHLQWAFDALRREGVDQYVFLGDAICHGKQLESTCRLLLDAGAIGVWGNHDLGLCDDPPPSVHAKYAGVVIDFMTSLKPRLEFGECQFMHVEPWLDPHDPLQINYYEGPPDDAAKLAKIFNAAPHRLLFAGHYHRWLLANPQEILPWNGGQRISLRDGKYYVVIGAVCEGRCAMLDTETWDLTPFNAEPK